MPEGGWEEREARMALGCSSGLPEGWACHVRTGKAGQVVGERTGVGGWNWRGLDVPMEMLTISLCSGHRPDLRYLGDIRLDVT